MKTAGVVFLTVWTLCPCCEVSGHYSNSRLSNKMFCYSNLGIWWKGVQINIGIPKCIPTQATSCEIQNTMLSSKCWSTWKHLFRYSQGMTGDYDQGFSQRKCHFLFPGVKSCWVNKLVDHATTPCAASFVVRKPGWFSIVAIGLNPVWLRLCFKSL